LSVLGIHDHEILGHPDGRCDGVDHETAVASISATIRRVRPDVIVTFGPDGITGHPDHVAVSRWATDAAARTGRAVLLYAVSTESFLTRHRDVHERLSLFDDASPRVPDADVALAVSLSDDELGIKRRALAAHASQTVGLAAAMGEARYRRWYELETFRRPTAAETGSLGRSAGVS
jgi:LmbE family N-acetylglucosaminyl deacetylase